MFGYLDNFQHSVILNLCVKVECIVEEIWKDITGYEEYYQVSNYGNVRSLDRTITCYRKDGSYYEFIRRGKLLRRCPTNGGHLCVTLAKDNQNNTVQIRHIMAQEFLGSTERLPLMSYIDKDPTNLKLNNLQFITFEDLPGEIWRPVEDFESIYEVSNKGRIRSCERTFTYYREGETCQGFRNSILIKTSLSKDGYEQVQLNKDSVTYDFNVHRLVAQAFLPNPDNLPQVNHIDGIRNHNEDTNLEWCTCKENINDAISKRGRGNLISAVRATQGRKVKCLDTGCVFDSIGEVSQILGCDAASIPSSIERESCCFGWTFVFVDMIDESFDELGYLNAAQNRYYKWPRAKRKEVNLWKSMCSAAV